MKKRLDLILFTLLLLLVFVGGFFSYEQANDVEASNSGVDRIAVPVIEVSNGRHGSIWKFYDDNRECYFNSAGGIWCTD